MTSCIYDNMDYGGWSSPCGYATMVGMIIGNLNIDGLDLATGKAYGPYGNYSMPGYVFDGGSDNTWKFSTTMKTAADYQSECQQFTGASYFSFEREYQSWMGVQINECFCKAEYTSAQIPTGLTDLAECHHYHMWEFGATHDLHTYDPNWVGASGPTICGKFQAESVQSIATISLNGYANTIVAAASPSRYEFGTGYLTFCELSPHSAPRMRLQSWNTAITSALTFTDDASTLNYLGCAEAGVKPEGIASTPDGGKVACLNEGSMAFEECNAGFIAREDRGKPTPRCQEGDKYVLSRGEHFAMDHKGSMTMCAPPRPPTPINVRSGLSVTR